jgi:hypothetical protein
LARVQTNQKFDRKNCKKEKIESHGDQGDRPSRVEF